jgi:hypothetical protein
MAELVIRSTGAGHFVTAADCAISVRRSVSLLRRRLFYSGPLG